MVIANQKNEKWCSNGQHYVIFFIVMFCFAAFYIAPVRTPFDSFFTIHTAYSFLHGDWGSLAEFVNINPSHHSIGIGKDGLPYNVYPVGSVFFSLPFVMLADALVPNLGVLLQNSSVSMELEAVTVAFWCAIATAMMFRLTAEMTRSINIGLAAAFFSLSAHRSYQPPPARYGSIRRWSSAFWPIFRCYTPLSVAPTWSSGRLYLLP